MRTLDFHRGLTTLLGAGVTGLLIWIATRVGQQTTGRFWASLGIIAGAGLVMAASQLLGGWTKFGWPRISLGVLLVGFLPVLVCTGWILMATQPGAGWHRGTLVDWSHSLSVFGFVREVGLYHGVLAFGLGLVLGYCFDTTGPRRLRETAVVTEAAPAVADEPVTAERSEVARTVPVGPLTGEPVPAGSRSVVGDGRRVEVRDGYDPPLD